MNHRTVVAAAVLGGGVMALALSPSQAGAADFKVYYPTVTKGEFEFENRAFETFDSNPDQASARNFTTELGYGVTDFWFTEIENEFEKEPHDQWRYTAFATENIFQLLPQGEHFVDLGFFAEYEFGMVKGSSDGFIFGPVVQKQFGRFLATANLFVEAQFGGHEPESPSFSYALEGKYLLHPLFQPGFQVFGSPGPFAGFHSLSEQDHRGGPVIFGDLRTRPGRLRYEIGYLAGFTHDTPSSTLKLLLEYEIAF